MKKLFSVILLISLSLGAMAQLTMTQTDPAGASATVNTNADTSYHTIDLAGQTKNYEKLLFVIAGTKTSGTVAGNVTLWGSVDNSRWFAVYGGTNAVPDTSITTQALSDADNNIVFQVDGTRWRYYRVRVITSGTQVSSYVSRLHARKVAN